MADPKPPSKPAAAAEPPAPASKGRAEGIDPKAVYVGGESLADRLLPHAKKMLIGIGVVAGILGIYFVYQWYARSKAEKATSALMTAVNEYHREVVEPPAEPEEIDPDLPPPPRTFATDAERTTAALAAIANVPGSHRKAVALLEARLLLAADRNADAVAVYERTSKVKGLEGVLAREGLAHNAEDAALELDPGEGRAAALRGALELYRAAQPAEDGPRREIALYNEGRILAMLGDKDGARAAFAKAAEKADPELESTIDVRLSQLDAKAVPALPAPGAIKPKPETPEEVPAATTDGGAAAPVAPDAGG